MSYISLLPGSCGTSSYLTHFLKSPIAITQALHGTGTYTYIYIYHASSMEGSKTVGTPMSREFLQLPPSHNAGHRQMTAVLHRQTNIVSENTILCEPQETSDFLHFLEKQTKRLKVP